jgi:glutathione S-transferase
MVSKESGINPPMTTSTQPKLVLCELTTTDVQDLETFSPFCLKAHRALKLARLTYERRFSDRPDAYKSINPTGQVPVLLVGEKTVADSTAILREIETMVPGVLSASLDARNLAEAWLWEEFADVSLNGFFVAARWADENNWPLVRMAYFSKMPGPVRAVVPALLRRGVMKSLHARDIWRSGSEACWTRYATLLDQLDARAPQTGFWMGDALSVADVGLFSQLHGLRNRYTQRQSDMIASRKTLSAWLDRVNTETK